MKKSSKSRGRHLPVLPPMRCDEGCGDCCGPAPASEEEFAALERYVLKHNVPLVEQGVTCPLYQNGRCGAYEVRPMSCRLFGHTEGMPCSRGYNTNIPPSEVARALSSTGRAVRVTHELLLLKNPLLTRDAVLQRAVEKLDPATRLALGDNPLAALLGG